MFKTLRRVVADAHGNGRQGRGLQRRIGELCGHHALARAGLAIVPISGNWSSLLHTMAVVHATEPRPGNDAWAYGKEGHSARPHPGPAMRHGTSGKHGIPNRRYGSVDQRHRWRLMLTRLPANRTDGRLRHVSSASQLGCASFECTAPDERRRSCDIR